MLDVVELLADMPDRGLRAGNSGTIVEVYDPDNFEVEFMDESGDTIGLACVNRSEIRSLDSDDAADRPPNS